MLIVPVDIPSERCDRSHGSFKSFGNQGFEGRIDEQLLAPARQVLFAKRNNSCLGTNTLR
jgi:hypothetical protein